MSDILLQKPQAGQVVTLAPQAKDRLVFEFSPDDALLERNLDTLVLSFKDGSSIQLVDFYVSYTAENMPEFVIDGEIVDGQTFFAAFEDLLPALGQQGVNGGGTIIRLTEASLNSEGVGTVGNQDNDYTPGVQREGVSFLQTNTTSPTPTTLATDGGTGAGAALTAPELSAYTAGLLSAPMNATKGYLTYQADGTPSLNIIEISFDNVNIPVTSAAPTQATINGVDAILTLSADGKTLTAVNANKTNKQLFKLELTDNLDGTASWSLNAKNNFDSPSFQLTLADQFGQTSSVDINVFDFSDMSNFIDSKVQQDLNAEILRSPDTNYVIKTQTIGGVDKNSIITTANGADLVIATEKIVLRADSETNSSIDIDTLAGTDKIRINEGIVNRYASPSVDLTQIRSKVDIDMGDDNDIVYIPGNKALGNDDKAMVTSDSDKSSDNQFLTRITGNAGDDLFNLTGTFTMVASANGTGNNNYATNIIEGGVGSDNISLNGKIMTYGSERAANIINGDSGTVTGHNQYTSTKDANDNHDILGLTNTVDNNTMIFKGDADNLDMHFGGGNKRADIDNIEEIRFGWQHNGMTWSVANDKTDDYNLDFSQVAAASDGSGLIITTANGDDTIRGTQGSDIINAGSGKIEIHANEGDDLINLTAKGSKFSNVLVDGGDGMDVLLIGASSLTNAIKTINNNDITNTELIIAGDNIKGTTTQDIFNELDINTNGNNFELSSAHWTRVTNLTNGYTELTNIDDSSITILVETAKLSFV